LWFVVCVSHAGEALAFGRAVIAAGLAHARPYDLRHSFASLLLHEGRSVIYVARQLGHDARLTLTRYGHVIDELEDAPRLEAEQAIITTRPAAHTDEPGMVHAPEA
jgi:integrase